MAEGDARLRHHGELIAVMVAEEGCCGKVAASMGLAAGNRDAADLDGFVVDPQGCLAPEVQETLVVMKMQLRTELAAIKMIARSNPVQRHHVGREVALRHVESFP